MCATKTQQAILKPSEELSLEIKSLRTRIGYNQDSMANYLQISKAAYVNKENCKNEFTLLEAINLCVLFGKSVEEIFLTQK